MIVAQVPAKLHFASGCKGSTVPASAEGGGAFGGPMPATPPAPFIMMGPIPPVPGGGGTVDVDVGCVIGLPPDEGTGPGSIPRPGSPPKPPVADATTPPEPPAAKIGSLAGSLPPLNSKPRSGPPHPDTTPATAP